jgi:hypothetical protein
MTHQLIAGLKSLQKIVMATMVALGSTMTMTSTATAITLQISVESLAPPNGNFLTPTWFAFHDGSFDLYDLGSLSSPALEYFADGGVTGLDTRVPGWTQAVQIATGNPDFNGTYPSFINDALISTAFARSSAGRNGGVQDIVFTDDFSLVLPGNFRPGQTATRTITLDDNNIPNQRYFTYADKLIPNNDAFIGNDDPIEIFDSQGNFIGADFIVTGDQVLDAGVEVNDELLSSFIGLGVGPREHGVVRIHPGIKPVGAGGVLDIDFHGPGFFANGNFKAPGYPVARITVTQVPESVPEPATITGLLALGGLFVLRRQVRQARRSLPEIQINYRD